MQRVSRLPIAAAIMGLLVLGLIGCERAPQSPTGNNTHGDKLSTSRAVQSDKPQIVAYYFHRTLRCATCLSIEKLAREALKIGYSDDLKSGRIEWRLVNLDDQGNEHFAKDFGLETSSLVLAEMVGKRALRWELLVDVWDLVDNPSGFQQYVWAEVDDFLEPPSEAGTPDEAAP